MQPPPDFPDDEPYLGEGPAINSDFLNGLNVAEAKEHIVKFLEAEETGRATVQYKLRDWLFSRQRYWGEPFPILHEVDDKGNPTGVVEPLTADELPLRLPELEDYKPSGRPEPPLGKAADWVNVTRNGKKYRRETNTMPQWAGSCWYYLRFCDPRNDTRAWSPESERYWMPVDLYVGGAEHAVLHLLYARFWHKVLFDRGHVSTREPFQRLVNQGMILSITYLTAEGRVVPYDRIRFGDGKAVHAETGELLAGETEKMSKSRGNVIPVDVPLQQYGADTTRLYEMFMGPIEATKPWSMQGVEGIGRFLGRAWRMIVDDEADDLRLHAAVTDAAPAQAHLRVLHRTIRAVTDDFEALRFNTAISRLMEFVNVFTGQAVRPRSCMEPFVLMLAPLAPHIAEELWEALGRAPSVAQQSWPTYEPALVASERLTIPIQVNGKVRSHLVVPVAASSEELERMALGDPKIQKYLDGHAVQKVIVVPKKLINIVVLP